jgi:hypothetical protein
LRPTGRWQALGYCAALLDEQHGIFFAQQILLFRREDAKKLF